MISRQHRQGGFTIVELLIVIVIIAILAAIVVVAYNGLQARGRDSRRVQDMSTIMKALEVYKVQTGSYPAPVSTAGASGWEVSTDGTNATNFLSALTTGSPSVSKIPVDLTNKGTATPDGALAPAAGLNNFEYFYYRYAAGDNGCDAARGDYYVLGIARMDSIASGQHWPQSPGLTCVDPAPPHAVVRDWAYEGAWVTGKFTK